MVILFPIGYMQAALLGVTRKLVRLWLTGCHQIGKKSKSSFRLSSINLINEQLSNVKLQLHRHFARIPKYLREVDRWRCCVYER